jgi:hypothetical protein
MWRECGASASIRCWSHGCCVQWGGSMFITCQIYQVRAQVCIDTQLVLKPLLDGLAVRTEVIDRISMMTRALVSRPTLEEIARTIEPHFDSRLPPQQQAFLNELEQRIFVGPGERENIYEIRYHDEDRKRAMRVVRLLLKNPGRRHRKTHACRHKHRSAVSGCTDRRVRSSFQQCGTTACRV